VKDLHRGILEIFAEGQRRAPEAIRIKGAYHLATELAWAFEGALHIHTPKAKTLDNAERYKNLRCNTKAHAEHLLRRRAAYAVKRGGKVRVYRNRKAAA
jgi:hypothetical protein